jgi:hypothetical protein
VAFTDRLGGEKEMASCEAGGLGNTVDGHFVSFFIANDGSKSMREGRERGKTDVRKWNEPTFKKKTERFRPIEITSSRL